MLNSLDLINMLVHMRDRNMKGTHVRGDRAVKRVHCRCFRDPRKKIVQNGFLANTGPYDSP
jgi:hypothetical protein